MDKEKIDLEVYDKCVDASVALFMQYYCAAVSEDIHKEILEMQAEEKVFPETLDTRCRATIKKQNALSKRRKCFKSVVKGLRYVAVFAVVLLALSSVLFVSVEAIRVPIINYYISLNGKYLEIGSSDNLEDGPTTGINWEDPLAEFVPKEYVLSVRDDTSPGSLVAIYRNAQDGNIFFAVDPLSDSKQIDTENAQIVRKIQFYGSEGVLVVKNDLVTFAWGCEEQGKMFSITSTSLNEAEIITLAEEVMQQIM